MIKPTALAPCYEVRVADNFHYMDKDAEYSAGFFASAERASEECMAIVDMCLKECGQGSGSAEQIFAGYRYYGEDPFGIPHNRTPAAGCSAWDYAEKRSKELAETSADRG